MTERPEKLVQELVDKVYKLAEIHVAMSLAEAAGVEIDKSQFKDLGDEAVGLAEKIVSRMAVNGDV